LNQSDILQSLAFVRFILKCYFAMKPHAPRARSRWVDRPSHAPRSGSGAESALIPELRRQCQSVPPRAVAFGLSELDSEFGNVAFELDGKPHEGNFVWAGRRVGSVELPRRT
jgi:hypothetical protein